MARWTGTWLGGASAAGLDDGRALPPGVRLGLPAEGPGSLAPFGTRAVAFAIDALLAGLVARLFFPVRDLEAPQASTSLAPLVVFALVYLVGLCLRAQTPGMWARGLRLALLRDAARPHPGPAPVEFVPAALRTALLMLLIPAVVSYTDGRGLHDRAAGTVVVRA